MGQRGDACLGYYHQNHTPRNDEAPMSNVKSSTRLRSLRRPAAGQARPECPKNRLTILRHLAIRHSFELRHSDFVILCRATSKCCTPAGRDEDVFKTLIFSPGSAEKRVRAANETSPCPFPRPRFLAWADWQVASPMFYAQEVERRRPDVKVVDINLLRRSWYLII